DTAALRSRGERARADRQPGRRRRQAGLTPRAADGPAEHHRAGDRPRRLEEIAFGKGKCLKIPGRAGHRMMSPSVEPPATVDLAIAVVVDAIGRGPFAAGLVLAKLGEVEPGYRTVIRAVVVQDDMAVEDDKLEELETGDRLGDEVTNGPRT